MYDGFVGAVANGRAKFEAQTSQSPAINSEKINAGQRVSPEKPMRFFGSRSRTNSPMLPVKTPKVPTTTPSKKQQEDSKLKDNKTTNDSKAEDNKKTTKDLETESTTKQSVKSTKLVLSMKR